MIPHVFTAIAAASLLSSAFSAEAPAYPPAKFLGDPEAFGRGVQRTMRLLATSTPEHRNTVRVLFYGQSITEQKWSNAVADDLRARFPNADLIIENRALGGYASQMLVRTAETDLYPFQPDLLIFHVFGSHDKYEDIIRRTRERTTAEILMQNDHLNAKDDWRHEETDATKVSTKQWSSFMNYKHLPAVAAKYRTGYVDQRAVWKRYLADHNLEASALLKDNVHLNPHGEWLMAECVKSHLVYRPELGEAEAEGWVKTIAIGKDARWTDGRLRVEFEGNGIEAIVSPMKDAKPLTIRIDGRKPSEFAELYGFTRALSEPGGKWPVIAPIGSERPLIQERWTMKVTRDAADEKRFTFSLSGSQTGADGEGRSDARFVSPSGRIVIDPESWNVPYALGLAGVKTVPAMLTVTWDVVPQFTDELNAPASGSSTIVRLASSLANTKHVIEITGSGDAPLHALRIHQPPLGRH